MKWLIFVASFGLIIFGFTFHSIASCESDCREAYDSAVESCKETYDDPDDADTLTTCLDNAKIEYESCIQECES